MSALADLINLDLSDSSEKIIAEYIWIGGSGLDMRSKARTLPGPVKDPSELPKWNYDGSSTGQAPGDDSEVIIYPQAIFKDPFRRGSNILVMCDAYTPAGEPIPTNKRHAAAKIFSDPTVAAEETWLSFSSSLAFLPITASNGVHVLDYKRSLRLADFGVARNEAHNPNCYSWMRSSRESETVDTEMLSDVIIEHYGEILGCKS